MFNATNPKLKEGKGKNKNSIIEILQLIFDCSERILIFILMKKNTVSKGSIILL